MDKEELKKIAGFGENDIGSTEENVKQKIVVPLLILLKRKWVNSLFLKKKGIAFS